MWATIVAACGAMVRAYHQLEILVNFFDDPPVAAAQVQERRVRIEAREPRDALEHAVGRVHDGHDAPVRRHLIF